jgi:hypothetical protein
MQIIAHCQVIIFFFNKWLLHNFCTSSIFLFFFKTKTNYWICFPTCESYIFTGWFFFFFFKNNLLELYENCKHIISLFEWTPSCLYLKHAFIINQFQNPTHTRIIISLLFYFILLLLFFLWTFFLWFHNITKYATVGGLQSQGGW